MKLSGIEITHPDKILFPKANLKKRNVARYYQRMADNLLGWARDRPLTFKIYPEGIKEDGFFNKNAPDHFPDFIRRIKVPLKSSGKSSTRMAAAEKKKDLVYFARQNVIEIHAALAKDGTLDTPDQIVLDLDPSDGDFDKVRKVARQCLSMLDQVDLSCFLKLTGSRGLHLHIPIRPQARFDEIKPLAQKIAEALVEACPKLTTLEKRKEKRGNKVFIDYLRNDSAQTVVLPYSLRAREGAPAAAPIRRDELASGSLKPDQYTAKNIFQRLARIEDPWKQFARHRIGHARLRKAIERL